MSGEPRLRRLFIGVCIFGAIAVAAFWFIWFVVDPKLLATLDTPAYYTFEHAFPLADGWLAICCALAAGALIRRRPTAVLWLLLAGSAAIFLGLMDLLFDLNNAVFTAPTGDWGAVVAEVVIILLCLGLGVGCIVHGWSNRAFYLDRQASGSPPPQE